MKWALITGASKRLGKQLALSLADLGWNIAIHYCSSESEAVDVVEKCINKGVKAKSIYGNFDTSKGIDEMLNTYLKEVPSTHLLINNVGNFLVKPVLETNLNEWHSLIQTNLNAPFHLIQKLQDSLVKNKGQIINIGVTGLSAVRPNHTAPAYYITKLALLGLTKSLAKELAPKNVRVNMVSPGVIDNAVDLDQVKDRLPMHRPCTTQEIARVVQFLVDEASDYITGQNIEVSGGFNL
ncbi:MAG: SDR family oxidoreductase [Parachlamydiales bacterium]|nr:SDR family oxidoreductase [Parachlamydiales bacterium]